MAGKVKIGGIMSNGGMAKVGVMSVPDRPGVAAAVLKGLGEQGVAEAVLGARVGDDDVRLGRFAQRRAQDRRLGIGRIGEHVVWQRAPERQNTQHILGRRVEPLDTHHQRVTQAGGRRAVAVEPGGQQLFCEQWVALAAREEPIDDVVLRSGAEDVGQQTRKGAHGVVYLDKELTSSLGATMMNWAREMPGEDSEG